MAGGNATKVSVGHEGGNYPKIHSDFWLAQRPKQQPGVCPPRRRVARIPGHQHPASAEQIRADPWLEPTPVFSLLYLEGGEEIKKWCSVNLELCLLPVPAFQ